MFDLIIIRWGRLSGRMWKQKLYLGLRVESRFQWEGDVPDGDGDGDGMRILILRMLDVKRR